MLTSLQLAEDYNPKKVQFPVIGQPKYDGVRAANLFGRLTARSLRPFDNRHASLFFSQSGFLGFDGEMAAAAEDNPLLCSLTTSALSSYAGEPWLLWHVFDYLRPDTINLPYHARYMIARDKVARLQDSLMGAHIQIMPYEIIENQAQLDAMIERHITLGCEGSIIRDPYGVHKNGRSSPTHRGLLRIKLFMEVDAIVLKIIEGQKNNNEATMNRLGHTERSTHAENMVPNGMVGAMVAELCEDAIHPITGKLVHRKGEIVQFGAGKMPHNERLHYFQNQHLINGKRIKGQIFPHGVKDKARFPTFSSMRTRVDVVDK